MIKQFATACTCMALSTAAVHAASQTTDADPASSSPVAYIYVSSQIGTGSSSDIYAFSAASNGKLTKITGSPFSGNVNYLAGNGKYLFGTTASGTDIDSWAIESNGALHYVASENVVTPDGGCGNANQIFLDHSGSTVYTVAYFGNDCTNNTYEQFKINNSTGKLSYLGVAGDTESIESPFSLIANNTLGYTVACYHFDPTITAFKRNSSGTVTQLSNNISYPKAKSGGYCGYAQTADPTNHIAVAMQANDGPGSTTSPIQLGTFTSQSNGGLTTSSTYSNMPNANVGSGLNFLNMAPSGKLLAVAGTGGLRVFHYNGASPITSYTGLLTSSPVDLMYWDNANHLYAISKSAHKLYVFTVTPTSASQAPGSPYTINSPLGIKVLPL